MLGIWCYRRILSDTFMWPNEQQGRLQFQRSVIVSKEDRFFKFDIVNLCQRPMGADAGDLILFLG